MTALQAVAATSGLPTVPAQAGAGFFLLFALFFLIFSVVLPLWVYSDAKSKGSDNAVLWALIVFLAPLLGLGLYLLIGDDY
jgi:hypothetical protein